MPTATQSAAASLAPPVQRPAVDTLLAQLARVQPANDVAAKRRALAPAKSAWSRGQLVAFGGGR